jgi:MFS family permease
MDGVGGYEGWRWIFILEGILTVLVALVAFYTIYDFPDTAPFLTEREREFVIHRLKYQGASDSAKMVAQEEGFSWQYVKDAFSDWQIYVALFSMSLSP